MSPIKWFKLSTKFFSDERVRLVESERYGDTAIVSFLELVCKAATYNKDGFVTLEDIESIIYSQTSRELLKKYGLLEIGEDFGKVIGFGSLFSIDKSCVVRTSHWDELRQYILERDNFTCQYCGETEKKLHADHVIAQALGGTDDEDNLVCACETCNLSKGKKTLVEWKGVNWIEKVKHKKHLLKFVN